MPFNRPTLTTILSRIKTDIEDTLTGANPRLARSFEGVLARVLAGLAHSLHGHIYWVAQQLVPSESSDDEYILRWADFYGLDRIQASAATGFLDATGTNGTVIASGAEWQRSDGTVYTTDSDTTISGGVASVPVTAQLAGADGNAETGTTITIVTPIAGLTSAATVDADALSGGADIESAAAILARLRQRIRNPPMGGGPGNYVSWALEVPGVTRAWEYANTPSAGEVLVLFVRDNDVSIIPDAGEIATVQAYIEARAPVTSTVTVAAPTEFPLSMIITDLNPNTAEVQAAILASLQDFILRIAEPGVVIVKSQLVEAIATAEGEISHTLFDPPGDVALTIYEIPTLGTVLMS